MTAKHGRLKSFRWSSRQSPSWSIEKTESAYAAPLMWGAVSSVCVVFSFFKIRRACATLFLPLEEHLPLDELAGWGRGRCKNPWQQSRCHIYTWKGAKEQLSVCVCVCVRVSWKVGVDMSVLECVHVRTFMGCSMRTCWASFPAHLSYLHSHVGMAL